MLQQTNKDVALCLERAQECRRRADETSDPAVRKTYLEIEENWLLLARGYETANRINTYVETAERKLIPAADE